MYDGWKKGIAIGGLFGISVRMPHSLEYQVWNQRILNENRDIFLNMNHRILRTLSGMWDAKLSLYKIAGKFNSGNTDLADDLNDEDKSQFWILNGETWDGHMVKGKDEGHWSWPRW